MNDRSRKKNSRKPIYIHNSPRIYNHFLHPIWAAAGPPSISLTLFLHPSHNSHSRKNVATCVANVISIWYCRCAKCENMCQSILMSEQLCGGWLAGCFGWFIEVTGAIILKTQICLTMRIIYCYQYFFVNLEENRWHFSHGFPFFDDFFFTFLRIPFLRCGI